MAEAFNMTNQGETNYYLGIKIEYNREKGECHLNQARYIEQIIKLYGYQDLKPAPTPMKTDAKLTKKANETASPRDITEYSARVRALNFLAIQTRPDISYAISTLSQFISNPNDSHWSALKRAFAYIKKTPTRGPTYTKGNTVFQGYTDSDWADNITDRKSTNSHIFLLQGAPISWRSKRQTSVALSSAEAEYIAASEAAKEALYLHSTLNTFFPMEKQIQTVILKEDNENCILIGSNPELHQRIKHIDMRYHFFLRPTRPTRLLGLLHPFLGS
jgi:hypothetical protein